MNEVTTDLNQAQVPVLESLRVSPNETLKNMLAPQVQDFALRPAYVWKTGKTFFLNKREQIIADTYIETRNFSECARRVTAECRKKLSSLTCQRWIERKEHIQDYLLEKFEEKGVYAGWSRERWVLRMTRHLQANAEYENLKDELKSLETDPNLYGSNFEKITDARKRMKELSKERLAAGDLYGMNLLAKIMGWDMPQGNGLSGLSINITQSNGMP